MWNRFLSLKQKKWIVLLMIGLLYITYLSIENVIARYTYYEFVPLCRKDHSDNGMRDVQGSYTKVYTEQAYAYFTNYNMPVYRENDKIFISKLYGRNLTEWNEFDLRLTYDGEARLNRTQRIVTHLIRERYGHDIELNAEKIFFNKERGELSRFSCEFLTPFIVKDGIKDGAITNPEFRWEDTGG